MSRPGGSCGPPPWRLICCYAPLLPPTLGPILLRHRCTDALGLLPRALCREYLARACGLSLLGDAERSDLQCSNQLLSVLGYECYGDSLDEEGNLNSTCSDACSAALAQQIQAGITPGCYNLTSADGTSIDL